MNYQQLPFPTVQALYDRIALLEWCVRQGEYDEMDEVELGNLKQLAKTYTKREPKTTLKLVLTGHSS